MTPFDLAQRLIGEVCERPGSVEDDAFILWCLESVGLPDSHDEVPWCSAFCNRINWLLRLPRSKSAAARSWLGVGSSIPLAEARPGFDLCVFKRGPEPQPGPEVTSGAQGHVGYFAGWDQALKVIEVVGGNQSNAVTLARFPVVSLLDVRRCR